MTTKVQWKRLDVTNGPTPKPRHGHRAVAIKDLIVIYGGGNDGIIEELNVFNCANNQWFQPVVKGDIPSGCAAFGFATDGLRIVAFGGMVEYGKYSSDLWELNPATWQWKKVKAKPPKTAIAPCARLGHTLTYFDGKFYLFGGLANDSKDPKQNLPRYLNDLYTLEVKSNNYAWEQPVIRGLQPTERESHSCVAYRGQIENRSKLIVYGGMNGHRLGDIWSYYLDVSQWTQITASGLAPQPRSLHSSVIIGHRMLVFGGWVPVMSSDKNDQYANEKEWRCTNTLASFNLENNTWELLGQESSDEHVPRGRAGHCAVSVNTRMYVWSGRDGYRKAWSNQVCCKDLWYLETTCPGEPEKVQLLKAGIGNLEVTWTPVPTAESYILQIQRFEAPNEQPAPVPAVTPQPAISSPSLQSISAPLFSSKSPQSVLASLIPTFSNDPSPSSASVSAISDTDPNVDQCLTPSALLNKSASDLFALAQLSSSQSSLGSSVSPQTLTNLTQPSNSIVNPTLLFQKPAPATVVSHPNTTIRTPVSSTANIQLVNTTSNSTVRPIIFHQKTANASSQPQLLTVMPANVRVQQLTPVVRAASNQPTTIVRLMSPATTTVRQPTGQQQIIQLNTNNPQQQSLVIKAITTNRSAQQQPFLLTTNPQTKTLLPQTQQVLVLNQNTLNNTQATISKLAVSMANVDPSNNVNNNQSTDNNIPQIDGTIDDQSMPNPAIESVLKTSSSPIPQTTNIITTDCAPILKSESGEFSLTPASSDSKPLENDDDSTWHLVGTFKTTTVDIKHYYVVPSKVNIDNQDLASLQVQNLVKKVDLEPGVIYKLRVAAVNACGIGPWSEAAAFKTCLPGAPPAPSNIKITKTADGGAHLTWDSTSNAACVIAGYAVYLAVKNSSADNSVPRQYQQQASQMAFVRVYAGALAECSVNAGQLLQAHLDTSSSKPAIIFRIAARNERGYGPATQVRWLQDQQQLLNNSATTANSSKRNSSNANSSAKKQRLAPNGPGSNDA